MDFVSSAGGCVVDVDVQEIDLGLLGSQKALSCPPDMAAVSISARAWAAIEETGYKGYDALLPFRMALSHREFPYTHNWHGLAALSAAVDSALSEGLAAVYARHEACAILCRSRVEALGLRVFPVLGASSPTITAVEVYRENGA